MSQNKTSITILLKAGRLPTWYSLSTELQDAYSREHVDLMLSVAQSYRMTKMDGYRLLCPTGNWERFWVIEFPSLAGAEAWIEAEMAPPYGRFGYYDYYLARSSPDEVGSFITTTNSTEPSESESDPHEIPELSAEQSSIVILYFERWLPGATEVPLEERGDAKRMDRLRSVSETYGLLSYESFRLLAPMESWHQVKIVEFADISGVEAWLLAETEMPHARYTDKVSHLTRRWAPAYFRRWIPAIS